VTAALEHRHADGVVLDRHRSPPVERLSHDASLSPDLHSI
jgi:hypothetical protein